MSRRRRHGVAGARAFTLLELLIAVALSTIILGVLAATFQYVTRAYDTSLARLDATRDTIDALERLDQDWARAAATPDPGAAGVEVHQPAVTPTLAGPSGPVTLRHDVLTLTILEPIDADEDGAVDRTRAARVRWSVEWDAAKEEGLLVRTASPVSIPGAPGLPTLAAAEREEVLAGVVEVRHLPWIDAPPDGDAFRDPPTEAALPAWRARLFHEGADASITSFELATATPLQRLEPGALVRLSDTRTPARFDQGLYTVRLRQTATGPRPHRLVLTTPPGDAPAGVRYTAAWLPPSLHTILDVRSRSAKGPVVRRAGRVLLRHAPTALLALPGGP